MGDIIIKFIVTLALAAGIFLLLPASPIQGLVANINIPYTEQLNWFIPVTLIKNATLAWLACITAYYAISWVMRNLEMIGN